MEVNKQFSVVTIGKLLFEIMQRRQSESLENGSDYANTHHKLRNFKLRNFKAVQFFLKNGHNNIFVIRVKFILAGKKAQ